ncbi:MAG: DUF5009 domain-containing protein [Magnetococcales bacterium]|nr:DUF5009 domain-containing protein [Magnetococcales bacterium]
MANNSPRLLSLDALRGATVAFMLVVNNPGDWNHVYGPLLHAQWHGWTPTDFIFPFFLWIVGVSMSFSLARRSGRGDSSSTLTLHILRRAMILFLLGLFLSGFPFGMILNHSFSLTSMRIPGVLQRIALCYLIAGSLIIHTRPIHQVIACLILVVGHGLWLTLVPVPGYGARILAPEGNWEWYVDSMVLAGHTWSSAPVPGFDPEGILSTLTALATTLMGVATGYLLQTEYAPTKKIFSMLGGGSLLIMLGLILDRWWIPINKNLWTSSYVIFTAGAASIILALGYGWIDIRGHQRWSMPLIYYGLNAIVLFFLSGIAGRLVILIKIKNEHGQIVSLKAYLYHNYCLPYFNPELASLVYALIFTAIMGVLALAFYRKSWFIKV